MEEVEDESILAACTKKKLTTHTLIHESKSHEDEKSQMTKHPMSTSSHTQDCQASCIEVEDEFLEEHCTKPKSHVHVLVNKTDMEPTNAEMNDHAMAHYVPLPLPPRTLKLVRMPKKQFYPVGELSVGVSVLSVKGWVGNLNSAKIDLCLDSCVGITLISLEYYDTLKHTPTIQQGM